jgi:hypothetical protein
MGPVRRPLDVIRHASGRWGASLHASGGEYTHTEGRGPWNETVFKERE